ncbi:MAG: hypothetical protein ABEI39_01995 [Halobacteriales archaeon]
MAGTLTIEGLAPDSAVLVSGPPMTGKYELMLRLLAENVDAAVFVTTKNGADELRSDFRSHADVAEDEVGVVDCVTPAESRADPDGPATEYVGSPSNLTAIGVAFTDLFSAFDGRHDRVGVGVHSVSGLLMHNDLKGVYQFLQVLAGQARSAGWFNASVVDASVAEDGEMIQHHFDGVIETRTDGEREFRARGLTPTASEWRPF